MTTLKSEALDIAPYIIGAAQGRVYAVDALNGAPVWDNGLKDGGYGVPALAITGRRVFTSAQGAMLFCLGYRTGDLMWTAPTSRSGRATILVHEKRLYVAKGGAIDCFTTGGEKLFSRIIDDIGGSSMALGYPGKVVQGDERG